MNNDTISRQAVISKFEPWLNVKGYSDGEINMLKAVLYELRFMPAAQPEREIELDGTESNIEILSELRSQFNCFDEAEEPCYRALSDAIQALTAQPDTDEWCHDCKEYDKERHCCPRWNRVIRETLKDAQPEIIRCKYCKHRPFDGEDSQGFGVEFPDERCPCQCEDGWYNWRPDNEWFCANAERGTDEQIH